MLGLTNISNAILFPKKKCRGQPARTSSVELHVESHPAVRLGAFSLTAYYRYASDGRVAVVSIKKQNNFIGNKSSDLITPPHRHKAVNAEPHAEDSLCARRAFYSSFPKGKKIFVIGRIGRH